MQVKAITLPFEERCQGFDDGPLQAFIRDKQVHDVAQQYFERQGRPRDRLPLGTLFRSVAPFQSVLLLRQILVLLLSLSCCYSSFTRKGGPPETGHLYYKQSGIGIYIAPAEEWLQQVLPDTVQAVRDTSAANLLQRDSLHVPGSSMPDEQTTLDRIRGRLERLPWWIQTGGIALVVGLFVVAFMYKKRSKQRRQNRASFLVRLPSGSLRIGNAQHIGERAQQQDAFGFSDPENRDFVAKYGILAVVADGMGGMELGAEASNAAVKAFLAGYHDQGAEGSIMQRLNRALGKANRAVLELAGDADKEGAVGTTLAAAVFHDKDLYWLSVGDSRIYRIRDQELTLLTRDHVYRHELEKEVAEGKITQEEADQHPDRHALTSYLGLPKLIAVDQCEEPHSLQAGDRVLLCSDGLYGSLLEAEMLQSLDQDAQTAAEALVRCALEKGKRHQDNITVMIIDCA